MKNSTDISIDLFRLTNILRGEELKEELDFEYRYETVMKFKNYPIYVYRDIKVYRDSSMLKWFIWDNHLNVRN